MPSKSYSIQPACSTARRHSSFDVARGNFHPPTSRLSVVLAQDQNPPTGPIIASVFVRITRHPSRTGRAGGAKVTEAGPTAVAQAPEELDGLIRSRALGAVRINDSGTEVALARLRQYLRRRHVAPFAATNRSRSDGLDSSISGSVGFGLREEISRRRQRGRHECGPFDDCPQVVLGRSAVVAQRWRAE
jgi:hypothetical protein